MESVKESTLGEVLSSVGVEVEENLKSLTAKDFKENSQNLKNAIEFYKDINIIKTKLFKSLMSVDMLEYMKDENFNRGV